MRATCSLISYSLILFNFPISAYIDNNVQRKATGFKLYLFTKFFIVRAVYDKIHNVLFELRVKLEMCKLVQNSVNRDRFTHLRFG
jgi:hypothetical protein